MLPQLRENLHFMVREQAKETSLVWKVITINKEQDSKYKTFKPMLYFSFS